MNSYFYNLCSRPTLMNLYKLMMSVFCFVGLYFGHDTNFSVILAKLIHNTVYFCILMSPLFMNIFVIPFINNEHQCILFAISSSTFVSLHRTNTCYKSKHKQNVKPLVAWYSAKPSQFHAYIIIINGFSIIVSYYRTIFSSRNLSLLSWPKQK